MAIPSAGGTAWDPTNRGAWVSNGLVLAKFDATCGLLCPPAPIPTLLANAFVSGLEYSEHLDELQIIDTAGFFHRYANACPPMPIQVCQTGLVPAGGFVTSALATHEDLGLVFIASKSETREASCPLLPIWNRRRATWRLRLRARFVIWMGPAGAYRGIRGQDDAARRVARPTGRAEHPCHSRPRGLDPSARREVGPSG